MNKGSPMENYGKTIIDGKIKNPRHTVTTVVRKNPDGTVTPMTGRGFMEHKKPRCAHDRKGGCAILTSKDGCARCTFREPKKEFTARQEQHLETEIIRRYFKEGESRQFIADALGMKYSAASRVINSHVRNLPQFDERDWDEERIQPAWSTVSFITGRG